MAKNFDPEIGRATRWQKGMSSPNPSGRPIIRLISGALRVKLAEVKPDDPQGRTYAEILAQHLVEIGVCRSPTAVAALNLIVDRLEGRARQQIEVADIKQQLRDRSDDERFHLEHGHWPEEESAETPGRTN